MEIICDQKDVIVITYTYLIWSEKGKHQMAVPKGVAGKNRFPKGCLGKGPTDSSKNTFVGVLFFKNFICNFLGTHEPFNFRNTL